MLLISSYTMLKVFVILFVVLAVLYKLVDELSKKQNVVQTANKQEKTLDERPVEKITIPTIQKPKEVDYSYLLEDIRNSFGKLYIKLTESHEYFKHCSSKLTTGVYFGRTKYTGEANKNGKREVALLLNDGTIGGKLNRKNWNNHEKHFTTDNLNWIGYSIDGDLTVVIAEKFKEEFVKHCLGEIFPSRIADEQLWNNIKKEIERQNLSTGEFHNKKTEREKGYEEGTYELNYNNRYQIAGCYLYVSSPFVAVGYAEKEPTNTYNPRAMVIKTLDGAKVGYVSEKELNEFYKETGGMKTPLIIEAHYYKGKLYGWMYTYTDNVEEYFYMANQYHRLLYVIDERSKCVNREIQINVPVHITSS